MPNSNRPPQSDIGPNRVRYNDWRQLDVPPLDRFMPTLPVSVVVPYFEKPEDLARTLAALERQTYPRRLFEVVVVDDGSQPPLAPLPSPLSVRTVRREGTGFSLAAARNAGAKAAAHPILFFLDCDILPEPEFLAAHARWHHVVSDAITVVGKLAYVDVDDVAPAAIRDRNGSLKKLFAGRKSDPSWVMEYLRRTKSLTLNDRAIFDAIIGIFGIRKAFFESVGGFCESFIRYGFEDREFAYRAYTCGALIVPEEKTFVWHQGRWRTNRPSDKLQDIEIQKGKIAHLVPQSDCRSPAPGRIFTVPRHVVTIQAGDRTGPMIAEDVETILADPAGDLVVRIELTEEPRSYRTLWLHEQFGPDPRVSIAAADKALDDFPFAAFHVSVPAGACEHGLVRRLSAALRVGVAARMALPEGGVVTITRTWALHRSRRTGLPLHNFGDVVTISPIFRWMLRALRGPRSAARFLLRLMA